MDGSKNDCDNVSKMLIELCNLDDRVFNAMKAKVHDNRDDFSYLQAGLAENSTKSIITHVNLFKKIFKCFKNNLNTFRHRVAHKIIPEMQLVDYGKVRKLNRTSLIWITQNSNESVSSKNMNNKGISNVSLTKVPSTYLSKDTNIYENQIVAGFLKKIMSEINVLLNYFETELKENIERLETGIQPSLEGTFCPLFIIYENLYKEYLEIKKEIQIIKNEFSILHFEYNQVLNCTAIEFNSLPKFTKIFQSEPHYREIFEHIAEWWRYGDFGLNKESLFLRIKPIDKIYEYYCLSQLIKELLENGYELSNSRKCDYIGTDDNYKPEKAINTRYDFIHTESTEIQKKTITLYYEPVISSSREWESQNGIGLLQIEQNSRYRTPDFLLKYRYNDAENFAIFDSKFSDYENIKSLYLHDVILKYYVALSNRESIKALAILQGRLDYNNSVHNYYNDVGISENTLPKINVYPVTPKSNHIKKVVEEALSSFGA
jgi:hypothetical protein